MHIMDPFIRTFTASQMRGAAMGSAVCSPLVSFLTNLRCRGVTFEQAVTDGILTTLCIVCIVAWGSSFVFRVGLRKNPWFRLEDHPLGEYYEDPFVRIFDLLKYQFECYQLKENLHF